MVSAARGKKKSELMHLIDLREFFHFMLVQPPKKVRGTWKERRS